MTITKETTFPLLLPYRAAGKSAPHHHEARLFLESPADSQNVLSTKAWANGLA